MNVDNKKIVLALAVIAMFAGIWLYASTNQDAETSYSPEGAWLMNGVVAGQSFLWMDTYTSDSNKPGISGTVMCTLPVVSGMTQSGHGSWVRIAKNKFAFTAVRILIGGEGQPAGTAKFWGTVTVDAEDEMSGTLSAQYFDLSGKATSPVIGPGISNGKRIELIVEDQR